MQFPLNNQPAVVWPLGGKGAECHPWQQKICQKLGKKGKKSGNIGEKRGKIGKKRQKSGRFFHFPLLTDRAGSTPLPASHVFIYLFQIKYFVSCKNWHGPRKILGFFDTKSPKLLETVENNELVSLNCTSNNSLLCGIFYESSKYVDVSPWSRDTVNSLILGISQ